MICLPGKVTLFAVLFILKDASLLFEQNVVLRCDAGEGCSVLEVSFEVLQKVTMKISVFCDIQAVASAPHYAVF
jgi:hypothetical protein